MALQTLSEYDVLTDSGVRSVIVAEKLSDAAAQIEAAGTVVLMQVSRIKASVQVDVPVSIPNVLFEVLVSPDAAAVAGCVALPGAFTVPAGEGVILESHIPSGANFIFDGWYRGATLLSHDARKEIVIAAPTGGATSDYITAKFTAVI
jgi:hypothetical protein